ncbi:MAG TPA: serine/threonine-protein kinase [Myxococcota bacterium]|nr:serine/threonine-protein kinase [Myxococcota bacterium]HQK50495.1 serine/threonine-protein kinase [Myxococcota bacterium]
MEGQDPLLGQILGDDFRVVRLLGFGGFARVYLAEQLSVGRRKVALKVLHAAHGDVASAVAGLKREAAYLAMVRSPCFPRVLRTGTTPEGIPYFAMELVHGRTLETEIRERGPFPVDEAIPVLDQVMDGVVELHARDIVHRDLKPGNLFLEPVPGLGPQVRMVDLGSARAAYESDSRTAQGGGLTVGSPPYAAPETALTGQTSEASDLYSLGCVAYEILAGARALHLPNADARTFLEYLRGTGPIPVHRLGSLNPEVPEAVEEVVHKALQRDPRMRWGSVQEFRQAIRMESLPFLKDSEAFRVFLGNRTTGPRPEGTGPSRLWDRINPLRFRKG